MVEEPTKEDSILILKGLRPKYEEYHNVKITDESIEAAVDYSARYINDRFLPDKAIDLIDEASSAKKIQSLEVPENIKEIQQDIEEANSDKKPH